MAADRSNLDVLRRPLKLPCGATLENRLVKAAMTEGLADPLGRATEAHVNLYRRWASGGAALLITGNVMVDADHLERPGNVVIGDEPDPESMERLRAWAQAGTAGGNHLWMQLSHSGRQTPKHINPRPKAPSAVRLGLPGGQFATPEPLTGDEIERLTERFAHAAAVAKTAGFTGVQIHGAHGYLLSEFLSPRANRRNDRWGGSLEARARALRDVVAAVRQRCGEQFPLSVKLNSADFQKGGLTPEESQQVAAWLASDGIDLLEISGGTYEQPRMLEFEGIEPAAHGPLPRSTRRREAFFQEFAAAMRDRVDAPLMVTGGFRSRDGMAAAIARDGIAAVGLGRPLVVDTAAPARLLSGEIERLDRWERRLGNPTGFFGINSPVKIIKMLAAFGVMSWYYRQLVDHGDGVRPRTRRRPWRTLIWLRRFERRWTQAWRKGRTAAAGTP